MQTLHFSHEKLDQIYQIQHQASNFQVQKNTTASERLQKIKKIERYILNPENQSRLFLAMWTDLRKSESEVLTTEITPVLTAIQHVKQKLSSWMSDKSVGSPLALSGIYSHIRYEPKGHVLIIAPWNYPFQLVINPLIHAIAAGNVILIKPSEIAAQTALFLEKMISDLFDPTEIGLIQGDVPITTALLEKKFNHIFFTGSPAVGKIVMQAAAKHLTSVTLELGGKSPAILDETADVAKMGKRLAWAKTVNNGQICIAPDYLLIHRSQKEKFIQVFEETIRSFFNSDGKGIQQSDFYGRIIDAKNFSRLSRLLSESVSQGAKIRFGGELDESDKFISPTLLDEVTWEMPIMQEEIFGPILPILTFDSITEVPQLIERLEKPLALYILTKSSKNRSYLLQNTTAGGTVINEFLTTPINPNLPFGGVNNSGIGKSNGFHGFVEFSNERGVMHRKWMNFNIIYPPFRLKWVKMLAKIARW